MKGKSIKTGDGKSMSKADWKRFRTMKDQDIDTSDIPALDEHFWKNARVVMPKKTIALRMDEDVLDWFKSQGKDYQSRMMAVLRSYMEAQRPGRK